MSDDSLSSIVPNFEKMPATLQGISSEKVCVSPASDSRQSAPL